MKTQFDVEIRVGDIGLSGGDAFIQKAIRFFINSIWSHSFIVIPSPFKRYLGVMETTESRTVCSPLIKKTSEPDWIFIYRLRLTTEEQIHNAIDEAWYTWSGQWYGYLSYLWFIWVWFLKKLTKKYPINVWKWAKKGVTCSEYTATYLRALGGQYADLIDNSDLSDWNPQRLKDLMDKNPDLFIKIGWAIKPPAKILKAG